MAKCFLRQNCFLRPTAPVVTATQERAMDRQRAPSLHHQQTFSLRSLHKNGLGMFWKMECQERRCPRGERNSAQISGAPWSTSCVLYIAHRRKTQANDQSNCDLNFSHHARPASGLVAIASFSRLD